MNDNRETLCQWQAASGSKRKTPMTPRQLVGDGNELICACDGTKDRVDACLQRTNGIIHELTGDETQFQFVNRLQRANLCSRDEAIDALCLAIKRKCVQAGNMAIHDIFDRKLRILEERK